MSQTARKGDVTTLTVAAALAGRGETILLPFSGSERYDLALDRNGTLYRVQCKTGRFRNGAVIFNTCSTPRGGRIGYGTDIDAFGVFCAELGAVYLIPSDSLVNKTECWLRVSKPKDDRRRDYKYAADFRIN